MSSDVQLPDKVAAITGGSSGFGRAIATHFARHGARIVVGDLREQTAPGNFNERPELTTCELIAAAGGIAIYRRCDVRSREDVSALVAAATESFGRLDIMVNNAGIWRGGAPFERLSEDDLDACYEVIVKGSWFGSQEAMKAFIKQGDGGNIINIVSTASLRGHAGQAPYNIAKAAQANLTRCVAIEAAPHRVRVNGICPTFMKTAMSRPGYEAREFDEDVRRAIPAGRWGEADDVAQLALFLASGSSEFVHGALIPLEGGETLAALRSA